MATDPTHHPVHAVLNRPLEWLGVSRPLCVAAISAALLVWNITHAFPAALVVFLPCYGIAYWANQKDPQIVQLLFTVCVGPMRRWCRLRSTFDPLKHAPKHITVIR